MFARFQNFLDGNIRFIAGQRAKLFEILGRIMKPVHMVNAQAGEMAGANKLVNFFMVMIKYFLVLNVQAYQSVDGEKAPVIDA